ncbi:hypothetical protein JCM10207_000799 [Rhodosporidiobolus poonsookiae]
MPGLVKEPQYITFNSGGVEGRRRIVDEGEEGWVPTFESIPTISFRNINGTEEERAALAKAVGQACSDVGFFYVMDSPLPPNIVKDTFAMMERFFAQPEDVKLDAHWHKSPACRGYEPFFETKMGTDAKGNLRESFSMGDDFLDAEQAYPGEIAPGTKPQNRWPERFPELREGLYEYYHHVHAFARDLLKIFALALDLPEEALQSQYGPDAITGMRALHYPPQEPDESTPGLGAHSDFSSFTLVCQEPDSKPGLEVLNLNGKWVSAPPLPGCDFVVNTGDFLEQTTGGVFKSTIHRVYNRTGSRRYSLPFFFSPSPSATIQPLPKFASNAKATTSDNMHVGTHYVRRVLNSRKFHPSAVKLREKRVPMEEWRYEMMMGVGIPEDEEEVQA